MTEWQDISTAPKDGTWIQLWRPIMTNEGCTAAPLVFGRWRSWDEGEAFWAWSDDTSTDVFSPIGIERANAAIECGDCYESLEFSHWQPLPSPPSPTTEQRAS